MLKKILQAVLKQITLNVSLAWTALKSTINLHASSARRFLHNTNSLLPGSHGQKGNITSFRSKQFQTHKDTTI